MNIELLLYEYEFLSFGFFDIITREEYWQLFREELEFLKQIEKKKGKGGDFYNSVLSRMGKKFARAVLVSTMEGYTLFREAHNLLGVKKADTLEKLARKLGVF
jgi:hypothetical protein